MTDFDVIVVGGRPAGSSLAARLGQMGIRTLLVERAELPSLPGASCPIIYSTAMRLLDEIGADEAVYAHNTPYLPRLINVADDIEFGVEIPPLDGKRPYGYAIDRARFDAAIWETAVSYPSVTGRQNFAVHDLLWDADRVVGIVGGVGSGQREEITAKLVIGADGRFSTVARKVNAETFDEDTDYPTNLYYAYWKNVKPHDERGASATAYFAEEGLGFLVMDSADGTTAICMEGRPDILAPQPGKVDEFYYEMAKKYDYIRERTEGAEPVTKVHGMRKVGNMYRTPGGSGWGLVGDAYHQKDPIDGQGIFDALFTSKVMAQAIEQWHSGSKSWTEAIAWYDATARAETYPVYQGTLERVKRTIYEDPYDQVPKMASEVITQMVESTPNMPDFVKQPLRQLANSSPLPEPAVRFMSRTLARWLVSDSVYQEFSGMAVTRQLKPEDAELSPQLMLGVLARGPLRDLSRALDQIDQRLERIKGEA